MMLLPNAFLDKIERKCEKAEEVRLVKNRASLACQIRTNIRCKNEMSYQELSRIIKKEIPYDKTKHQRYILSFFEECYPNLMKAYMKEQGITRQQIIDLLNRLPDFGETFKFKEAVLNGEF